MRGAAGPLGNRLGVARSQMFMIFIPNPEFSENIVDLLTVTAYGIIFRGLIRIIKYNGIFPSVAKI